MSEPAFAFCFKSLGTAIEANTLDEALQAALDMSADDLEEVWCLRSGNLAWSSEGFGPWKDPEPAPVST